MKKLGNKGMTLVELIAAMTIMGIILTPITGIFYYGYSNYFVENDRMIAQQSAKEVVNKIINDLRVYENQFTEIDELEGRFLIIKDSVNFPEGEEIVYEYDEVQNMILRNGKNLLGEELLDEIDVLVNDFYVKETKPEGYDSSIINIVVAVQKGKSDELSVEGVFRRKYK